MTALVEHLERQVASSRRLLGIVLAQGEAIRRQDVEAVLARLADIQTEMAQRGRLEAERDDLLRAESVRAGAAAETLDLDAILVGRPAPEAADARALSAQLKGLLAEIARIHDQNRILLRQELSFLDHLMRVLSGSPQGGYNPAGWTRAPQAATAVNYRA